MSVQAKMPCSNKFLTVKRIGECPKLDHFLINSQNNTGKHNFCLNQRNYLNTSKTVLSLFPFSVSTIKYEIMFVEIEKNKNVGLNINKEKVKCAHFKRQTGRARNDKMQKQLNNIG